MIQLISKRPWLLIVFAFIVLISGWVFLLKLAARNQPETVPIQTIELKEASPDEQH